MAESSRRSDRLPPPGRVVRGSPVGSGTRDHARAYGRRHDQPARPARARPRRGRSDRTASPPGTIPGGSSRASCARCGAGTARSPRCAGRPSTLLTMAALAVLAKLLDPADTQFHRAIVPVPAGAAIAIAPGLDARPARPSRRHHGHAPAARARSSSCSRSWPRRRSTSRRWPSRRPGRSSSSPWRSRPSPRAIRWPPPSSSAASAWVGVRHAQLVAGNPPLDLVSDEYIIQVAVLLLADDRHGRRRAHRHGGRGAVVPAGRAASAQGRRPRVGRSHPPPLRRHAVHPRGRPGRSPTTCRGRSRSPSSRSTCPTPRAACRWSAWPATTARSTSSTSASASSAGRPRPGRPSSSATSWPIPTTRRPATTCATRWPPRSCSATSSSASSTSRARCNARSGPATWPSPSSSPGPWPRRSARPATTRPAASA